MIARGVIRRNASQVTTSIDRIKLFTALTSFHPINRSYSVEPKANKGKVIFF